MILQALTRYYETLLDLGKIAAPGWADAKVAYGLELGDNGELLDLIPYRQEEAGSKKSPPHIMKVPMPVKRSVGIAPNFLCDNAGYLLGNDNKGKPARTASCFAACQALHHKILDGVDCPAAHAVLAFFDTWQPSLAAQHPRLAPEWDKVLAGVNLIFTYNLQPIYEIAEIRDAWQNYYDSAGGDDENAAIMPCLVTGKIAPVALIHPSVRGVRDAQSSGAALISFNAPAFESYGREQGMNAPMSKYAAFAYTTALNSLLADREHCTLMGDATVVCWAEHGSANYQDACMAALLGTANQKETSTITDQDLRSMMGKLASGQPFIWQDSPLDPDEHFYVLGLAPNAARVSVRFFFSDTFGRFARNIEQHYKDIEVPRSSRDKYETLPYWKLLDETVNQNARVKSPSAQMTGDLLRAILTGTPYPATLLNGANLRIRAEHEVTRGRAAIIKGYYTRHGHPHCPKEVLEMEDPNTNIPYAMGQLFSVYEQIQLAANPGINATIKDKYFNSAAATPGIIFPILGNLAEKHLRKLTVGKSIYYRQQIGPLSAVIGKAYPTRLDLPSQGSFQLGYYYQNMKHFEKKAPEKEETENV